MPEERTATPGRPLQTSQSFMGLLECPHEGTPHDTLIGSRASLNHRTTVNESGHKLLQVICDAKRIFRRSPPDDGLCAFAGQCLPLIDAFVAATQPDDAANIDLSSKHAQVRDEQEEECD